MEPAFGIVQKTVQKDQELASNYRMEGNAFYQERKFYEALECYNKCLCFAPSGSDAIPLAYANRSAIYLEVNEYQLCLTNIQLARKSNYPAHKMQTLIDREDKCRKLMQTQIVNPDDDPWSFFHLSYPANEKIPFIVNCLEQRENEKFGRYIVSNQDLKPGDVIAIEEPMFKSIEYEATHMRCTNCLRCNKMSLIPSDVSSAAMFCSTGCMETATRTYLHAEWKCGMIDINQRVLYEALAICGGSFEKLKQLIDDPELSRRTIFDFDFNDKKDRNNKYKLLLAFNSLTLSPVVESMDFVESHPVLNLIQDETHKEIAKSFMQRVFRIFYVNSLGLDWNMPLVPKDGDGKKSVFLKDVGTGIFVLGCLFNHSCDHNINRITVDNKLVFFANRNISKGDQLFDSYGPYFPHDPREERQAHLLSRYGFHCSCEACTENFPGFDDSHKSNLRNFLTELSKVKDHRKEFRKNCKTLRKCHNYKNLNSIELMFNSMFSLARIAKLEPHIF